MRADLVLVAGALLVAGGLTAAGLGLISPPVIRSVDALEPAFREKAKRLLADAEMIGIPLTVLETKRTRARQEYLYGIGRLHSLDKKPVTQTLQSKHLEGAALDVWPKGYGFDDASAGKVRELLQHVASQVAPKHGLRNLPSIGDYGHFEVG